MQHAKDDATLRTIKWLSSEGIHGTPQLKESAIASYLQLVLYRGTRPVSRTNPAYERFKEEYKKKLGTDPVVFTQYVYDTVFLIGRTIVAAGKYDGEAIKEWFPKVAERYYGASGWCVLDEGGDRAIQDYAIWTVASTDGGYDYKDIGYYSAGVITWG